MFDWSTQTFAGKKPEIDNLPNTATIAQARQQVIEYIQLKMLEVP